MKAHLCVLLLAACNSGTDMNNMNVDAGDDPNVDAKNFMDAPPVGSINLSGKTSERGLTGESVVSGVTMTAYSRSNESTAIAMGTSNAQGDYTLTVNVVPLDGFLKATKSGYVDIYLYPAAPFAESFADGHVNMLTPGNRGYLNSLANGGQTAGMGMIGLQVRDASGNPVAGATVSSTPASGAYRYTGSNGLPSSSATSTSADGVAFMFNVPSGDITVTASKTSMTFKAHVVKAPADKFTTTSVEP